jgi:hypothetical protein
MREDWIFMYSFNLQAIETGVKLKTHDNDNDKPIKSLLKGKGLLPPVGLARLDSQGELLPMSF